MTIINIHWALGALPSRSSWSGERNPYIGSDSEAMRVMAPSWDVSWTRHLALGRKSFSPEQEMEWDGVREGFLEEVIIGQDLGG